MPRGGARAGAGRPSRTKSKFTDGLRAGLERERQQKNFRTGVSILSEAANFFRNLASRFQPDGPTPNEDKFITYYKLACEFARDVAPFEVPRLAAVTVREVPYDLSRLSDAELDQLDRLTRAAAVEESDRIRADQTRH